MLVELGNRRRKFVYGASGECEAEIPRTPQRAGESGSNGSQWFDFSAAGSLAGLRYSFRMEYSSGCSTRRGLLRPMIAVPSLSASIVSSTGYRREARATVTRR